MSPAQGASPGCKSLIMNRALKGRNKIQAKDKNKPIADHLKNEFYCFIAPLQGAIHN
jgi:hypothetical protein